MRLSNRFCRHGGLTGSRSPSRWTARSPEQSDREDWERLFADYCNFYEQPSTVGQRDRVWTWIEAGTIHCRLAVPVVDPSQPAVGLAHVRPYPSPLRGLLNGYLDDLFVTPVARGTGAFETLLGAVHELARAEGWPNIRWITAADNARAQAAYDRLASRTSWVTYQLDIGSNASRRAPEPRRDLHPG